MGQIVDYGAIEEKLSKIIDAGNETEATLKEMDQLIQGSVGEGGSAWDGESASQFRESWDALAQDIPNFITVVKNQATNVQTMLAKTKDSDTNGSVSLGGN